MLSKSQKRGHLIEEKACKYLEHAGLQLIMANYSCKSGEIDLIMQEKETLVFIEVRYRKQDDYGGGVESITRSKQCKIIRTATSYLQENNLWDKVVCRFDVVVAYQEGAGEEGGDDGVRVSWIKDAFWAKF